MKPQSNPFLPFRLLAAACALLLTGSASATTYHWTGSGNSNYTDSGNWLEGSWTEWNNYVFGSAVTNGTVNINAGVGTGSLTLDNSLTQDVTLNGSHH